MKCTQRPARIVDTRANLNDLKVNINIGFWSTANMIHQMMKTNIRAVPNNIFEASKLQ